MTLKASHLNLKYGIIVPPAKPGGPVQRVAVDSSQKVKMLDKTPGEFQRGFLTHALPVSAPEIRAHLMQDATHGQSIMAANHADSHIVYDYKSQKFMMSAAPVAGAKPREVPVGEIASNGRVASFADGHSYRYADSFSRSSAAASYNGEAHNSGASHGGSRSSGLFQFVLLQWRREFRITLFWLHLIGIIVAFFRRQQRWKCFQLE
jgi:hypothetical protein